MPRATVLWEALLAGFEDAWDATRSQELLGPSVGVFAGLRSRHVELGPDRGEGSPAWPSVWARELGKSEHDLLSYLAQ
jgi:hypothetical protein